MKKKLQSGRGASITFALLLFLVCAVIGSIVLSAAMTAAGRMADLGKADSRYYLASSAAQLFCDKFDGKEVVFQRVRSWNRVKTTTIAADGTISIVQPAEEPDDDSTVTYQPIDVWTGSEYENYTTVSSEGADLLDFFSYERLTGKTTVPTDLSGIWERTNGQQTETLEISLSGAGGEAQKIAADVVFSDDGAVVINFKSNAETGNQFTLQLTLVGDLEEVYETAEKNVNDDQPLVSVTGGEYTETLNTIFTETKTSRITWHVSDIQVQRGGLSE